jgi:hypothetical protein
MKNAVISDPVTGNLEKTQQDPGSRRESFGAYPARPVLIFRIGDN